MRTIVTTLSALTFLLAASASAQDRPTPSRELAPEVSYDFGDHEVDGGRYQPEGVSVLVGGAPGGRSLVRPRVHFVPEMLKSVENL